MLRGISGRQRNQIISKYNFVQPEILGKNGDLKISAKDCEYVK